MELRNESIRELLLSRLPRPENIAAYRKEVDFLLEKNKSEMSTLRSTHYLLVFLAYILALAWLCSNWLKARPPAHDAVGAFAGILFVIALADGIRVSIRWKQVELLKEVKQVQLQVLELQASLQASGKTIDRT